MSKQNELGLGPIEVVLSLHECNHIALCHPRFGQSIEKDGIRWFQNGDVLEHSWDVLTLPCRGRCNVPLAISMVTDPGPIEIPDFKTLNLKMEHFSVSFLMGECPTCKVVHAARSIKP